jgi:hypothetical protein
MIPRRRWAQFRLSTLFLIVTGICIVLAVEEQRSRLIVISFAQLRTDKKPLQHACLEDVTDFARHLNGRRVRLRGYVLPNSIFSNKFSSFVFADGLYDSTVMPEMDTVVVVHLQEGHFAQLDGEGRRSGVSVGENTVRASLASNDVEGAFVLHLDYFAAKSVPLYEIKDAKIVPKDGRP